LGNIFLHVHAYFVEDHARLLSMCLCPSNLDDNGGGRPNSKYIEICTCYISKLITAASLSGYAKLCRTLSMTPWKSYYWPAYT